MGIAALAKVAFNAVRELYSCENCGCIKRISPDKFMPDILGGGTYIGATILVCPCCKRPSKFSRLVDLDFDIPFSEGDK